MSINQKTIEFLKELYATNPGTDSIELQFMQISELVPFLPLLSKFSNLKRLSLHGNRIKELPVDLSQLRTLEQIDISNNMLNNCDLMIMSLKTIPKLKRLICPFKKEDEDKIKKGLLSLEFLNNSKVQRQKPKPKEEPKKVNPHELKPEDIEQAAKLFDDVRQLFKTSYQQFDDQQMMKEFNEDVQNLLGDMRDSLGQSNKNPELVKSVIYLTTRYSLYKPAQNRIVNFLFDVEKKYGEIVQTIFIEQSKIMKALTQVAMEMAEKIVMLNIINEGKGQAKNTSTTAAANADVGKVQIYEKELKRLRKERDELQSDISALEAENKKFLDALVRHSKGDKNLLYSVGSKRQGSSPRRAGPASGGQVQGRSSAAFGAKTKQFVVATGTKTITLKQLKDTIEQIYESKVKFDQKAFDSHLPRETMYQYLFTFLNQKYGLKNITIQWVSSIVSGIQNYSNQDNNVAVFGKILRNQCDEQFRYVQVEVKSTILQLLKMHLKTRHPLKTANEINDMMQEKTNGHITSEECEDIVKYMYNRDDSNEIIQKLKLVYALQPKIREQSRRPLTRQEQSSLAMEKEKKRIKFNAFVKSILDFQLRSHEKYLKPLVQVFRSVDRDADGIINQEQFNDLVNQMSDQAEDLLPKFLNIIDPYSTNIITFSQVCKLMSNYPEGEPILTKFLKEAKQ